MQLTTGSRIRHVVVAAIAGALIGSVTGLAIAGMLFLVVEGLWRIACLVLDSTIADPPDSITVPTEIFMSAVMIVCMCWRSVKLARKADRDLLEEYRAATNKCLKCGYSLTGIRRIGRQCPECGRVFKPPP
jgi:hypothetical protein